jgi:hypothetical protein
LRDITLATQLEIELAQFPVILLEECKFSIEVEPWAIHRLGELLKEFSTLKYSHLRWSLNPDNDLLIEDKNALPWWYKKS